MNKPVFDKSLTIESVSVEPADLGNMLDDTIAGGVAADALPVDAERDSVVEGQGSMPAVAPDLLHDERDGRRSIGDNAEDGTSAGIFAKDVHGYGSVDKSSVGAVASHTTTAGEASIAAAVLDAQQAFMPDPLFPTSADVGNRGIESAGLTTADVLTGFSALRQESASSAEQLSPLAAGDPVLFASIFVQGSDDPSKPDNIDLTRPEYQGFSVRADLLKGDDTIKAGGGGAATINGGEGNDYIIARLNYEDQYNGGADFDTVDFSSASSPSFEMWFDGYTAALVTKGAKIGFDVEKIIALDMNYTQDKRGDIFFLDSLFASVQRSWYWAGMAGYDDLKAGIGNDTLDGGLQGDGLQGGDGDDVLYGSRGVEDNERDVLWGGNGNDWLEGGFSDILIGGVGQDTLKGGWAWYTDYNYVSIHRPYESARWNFDFNYVAPVIDRTVDLLNGTATDGDYTDTLINVWQVSTGSGNDTLIASNAGAWFNAGGGQR